MKSPFSIAPALLFTAIIVSPLLAGHQDPVPPTLRELARQNGGRYRETVWTQDPVGRLPKLATEAELIVEGRVATMTGRLNREETAVRTVFTLIPERVFKDRLRLGTRTSPGQTEPLTFYEPGGSVDIDGLEITTVFRDAAKPALGIGDVIIGFFVKTDEGNLLRLHHYPYGLLRVRDGTVVAANDIVGRTRPLEHTNLAEVRADIQRLVASAARSK